MKAMFYSNNSKAIVNTQHLIDNNTTYKCHLIVKESCMFYASRDKQILSMSSKLEFKNTSLNMNFDFILSFYIETIKH